MKLGFCDSVFLFFCYLLFPPGPSSYAASANFRIIRSWLGWVFENFALEVKMRYLIRCREDHANERKCGQEREGRVKEKDREGRISRRG